MTSSAATPLDAAHAAFHPAVSGWFARAFAGGPTAAQAAAWPAIAAGRHTLVAAPTGSGKTLTAFMTAIDALVRQGLATPGGLPDETVVVYISPLKALSNDVQANLERPLAGIADELLMQGLPPVAIRSAVRTGDTPASERAAQARTPPHLLVTTPESLYVLLGSESGRRMLATARTVIVDEIHAVAASKRGSHLALSLARLDALAAQCGRAPLVRIGLSATVKPIDEVARFLVGTANVDAGRARCAIVDIGYAKQRDLALVVPPTPLQAVMSGDQWEQVYGQVTEMALAHRTTLVFVNTRRMAERAARHLGERLGTERVAAHHGSMARETRLNAEQRLKRGELKLLVATASLELGLDIGDVELVVQLGSPRAISTFLQRAGRAGHAVGGVPKARLFPSSRDELVECAALLDAVRRGELDALRIPPAPLDVLAQQIVAETACQEWDEDALHALVASAWPYARLERKDHDAVVRMLAEGFTTRHGPRSAWIHRDAVQRRVRARRGARLTALTSGGTIPDTADYAVVLEPQAHTIGTVNEDFAIESLAGDIFQLGNTSYRILRIEPGRVRVEDAAGLPPNIPFWTGEAPGRSDELSFAVSRLREEVGQRLAASGAQGAAAWLMDALGLDEPAATQIAEHLHAAAAVLGALPTQQRVVLERFFDESGAMQLIVHAPFGSRINRAWGLALRKRFCRSFNFELQAAATEDAILLSLSTSHSFPLEEVSRYLKSATAHDILVQALLDAPLFGVRWRWNATTALALPRMSGGKKVAPQLQRMKSEDLLAHVFPDQVACLENIQGDREVPDHPLVAQTMHDCLNEAMDAPGWLAVLRGIEAGAVAVSACDLPAPSALAAEVINARPYAFLDDAPLEERRTQAVQSRISGVDPGELGRLDPEAIESVCAEAWPLARSADEMHEALTALGTLTADEAAREAGWPELLQALAAARRATCLKVGGGDALALWVTAENLPLLRALHPQAAIEPAVAVPADYDRAWEREDAARELVRGRLGALGPVTVAQLAAPLGLEAGEVELALLALQSEGQAMQGRYRPAAAETEWCERHLLARIHRYTLHRLRREIEPVEPRDFARFLFEWQHLAPGAQVQGPEALAAVLAQLEGYEAPAATWEAELLPSRVANYSIAWLDDLCGTGRLAWTRLRPPASDGARGGKTSLHATPLLLLPRRQQALWSRLAPPPADAEPSARAQRVLDHLRDHGASFFDEITDATHLLGTELEDALAELVARGHVHCDSYAGLRALLLPAAKRPSAGGRRQRAPAWFDIRDAGRWALVRRGANPVTPAAAPGGTDAESAEHVVRTLLRRYGVLCWRLLEREAPWLPPWRELLRVCQRLEARGELRGGRFIAGVAGEQFALPEAVARLRQVRRERSAAAQWICVSAADPANLLGGVIVGERVPRIPGARVLYRDGVPVGWLTGGKVGGLQGLDAAEAAQARRLLLRGPAAGASLTGSASLA